MRQDEHIEVEFLGTGTSTGVPQIRCRCDVCCSVDARDQRLRASVIVRYRGRRILVDCGPDFRTQILRASCDDLDGLLITHIHYDHVGGLDDLRSYCHNQPFPIFARQDVIDNLRDRLPYCFADNPYPGVPLLDIHPVREEETFMFCDIPVEPIPVMHYRLPILGYRIGPLAYITDAKTIADDVAERLRGIPLLVVNALRKREHISHFSLDEALDFIAKVQPHEAWLTHMSHEMGFHAAVDANLPANVHLAYDGEIISV